MPLRIRRWMIVRGAAVPALGWEQRLEERPLRIGEFMTTGDHHTTDLQHGRSGLRRHGPLIRQSLCKHGLSGLSCVYSKDEVRCLAAKMVSPTPAYALPGLRLWRRGCRGSCSKAQLRSCMPDSTVAPLSAGRSIASRNVFSHSGCWSWRRRDRR
jgi:hypothetical protein